MLGVFMQTETALGHSEAVYRKEKALNRVRLVLITSILIFGLETLLMYFLESFFLLPKPYDWIFDSLVLVIFLLPLNYLFVFRPLAGQIEEHQKTNLDLMKTNEILERFFSISGVLIAYMDAQFNFLRVNEAYAAADERTPADFVGQNHFTLFPNSENRVIFENVVRTGLPYFVNERPFEYAGNPERGTSYWDWSLMPVKNPNGTVSALILVLTDVTERKKAQLALAESERRFRAVFNQTLQHMGLLEPSGSIRLLNQTALDFSGLTSAEVRGKPFWQLPWWMPSANGSVRRCGQRRCGQRRYHRAAANRYPAGGQSGSGAKRAAGAVRAGPGGHDGCDLQTPA